MSHLHPLTTSPPEAPPESSPDRPAQLRVSLVPFLTDNPYQRALAAELQRLGVEVRPQPNLKAAVREASERASRPEVVHLHWLPRFEGNALSVGRFAMFLARVARLRAHGLRIVWTVHNLYTHEAQHRRIERLFIKSLVRHVSRLIVHSNSAAELVRQEFQVADRDKITVVPHGHYIDCYPNTISRAEARRRLRLRDDAPVFLFFGKIRPYKGVRTLLHAFAEIAPPEAVLLIAGSPHNERVWSDVRRDVHNSAIQLHGGYIADEDVQVYMNAADAVVLPYQNVLTSGAVILAMSFAKACIAPRLGCLPDVLDDDGAVLYDPRTPYGLSTALRIALDRRAEFAAMGAHNFEKAREWQWEQIARTTATIYENASRSAARPAAFDAAAQSCGPRES